MYTFQKFPMLIRESLYHVFVQSVMTFNGDKIMS